MCNANGLVLQVVPRFERRHEAEWNCSIGCDAVLLCVVIELEDNARSSL